MNSRTLLAFFAIAFGLCWSIAGAFILIPDRAVSLFGELSLTNPLFFVATYAPAIAAFVLVLRHDGRAGLKRFLSRTLLWRAHWGWYASLLIGIPLCFHVGAAMKSVPASELFPVTSLGELLPVLLVMLFLGPVEEFGWRGLALPLLQRYMAPLWAGLVLGIIWSVWHIPAFLLSDTPQSSWSFLPFLVGSVSVSVVITALFNDSRGSLLLPILFHWQLINPAWPDAQPYDHIAFVLAAVIVVVVFRRSMLDRHAGITEVVPAARRAGAELRPAMTSGGR